MAGQMQTIYEEGTKDLYRYLKNTKEFVVGAKAMNQINRSEYQTELEKLKIDE